MWVVTNFFNAGLEVHYGSVLSSYMFSVVIDKVIKEIQGKLPKCMMFVEDIGRGKDLTGLDAIQHNGTG